ncbi:MAG: hypothetical protein QME51_04960 [Planctomycetota bacterium]|nr:hypothetical protein [Planctomycetota bacterium]MDI6787701.1 hypothetical protein [Planctomycetota bacterium]
MQNLVLLEQPPCKNYHMWVVFLQIPLLIVLDEGLFNRAEKFLQYKKVSR